MICRICGTGVVIRHTDIGYILFHLSEARDEDHGAVEDDGSYLASLPPRPY
jgi:hypothetical protein